MRRYVFILFFLMLLVFMPVEVFAQSSSGGGDGGFLGFSFAEFGNALIDILIDFFRGVIAWVAETLLPLIGVEPDVEGLVGGLDWIEDNAKQLNDLIPVFSGLGVIFGGVVAQWIVIILRYVFGYFVGG